MLNIIDLEKRWLRYKIKSYIPHATIVLSLVIISVLAFIILNSKNSEKKILNKEIVPQEPAVKIVSTDQKTEQNKIIPSKAQTEKRETVPLSKNSTPTKLQPSLSFIKDLQNSSLPYNQENIYKEPKQKRIKQVPPKMNKKKIIAQTVVVKEPIVKTKTIIQKKPEVVKTKKIIIKRQETKDDIKDVIKRFKVNNNPALSLFVAKKYYELGNYRESYNYALITNQINQDIESSWIIFAKSLVKLRKKEQAIRTLKEYIKISHSQTASLLIDEIESGNFK